jgi:restriction endonuclease S subunit
MMTQPAAAGGNDDAQEEETDTSTGKDWESVTLWVLKTRSNGNGNVLICLDFIIHSDPTKGRMDRHMLIWEIDCIYHHCLPETTLFSTLSNCVENSVY